MKTRIRLTIEYDGTDYAGWQRQRNAIAVQQRIEEAIGALTGEAVAITGASRTDAGVHARGQVAHFDTESAILPGRWHLALNTLLPPDIRIRESREADQAFHARFHATAKEYVYTIHNAPTAPAIGRQYVWHVRKPLDAAAMRFAAGDIIGTHDFSACMAAGGESKTFVRTIYRSAIECDNSTIRFRIYGNGFLYNMVRILAGSLVYVGIGKLSPDCVQNALRAGDRLLLGPTAPPQGLTLMYVEYNPQ